MDQRSFFDVWQTQRWMSASLAFSFSRMKANMDDTFVTAERSSGVRLAAKWRAEMDPVPIKLLTSVLSSNEELDEVERATAGCPKWQQVRLTLHG